ncbi:DUF2550 domain-containing protein [Staphylococcus chromogenes]|nr:DUF2550 domain-containing protein [Staphylococcus chromogenes]
MLDYLLWGLTLLVLAVAILAVWRFFTQRSRGTQVIVRRLPAKGSHGWRHGIIRYRGEQVECFKLRSVSPSPDIVLRRDELVLSSRREKTAAEQRFMPNHMRIVVVKSRRGTCEWAMDAHSEMALLAWLESAPTRPIIRMSPRDARKYFTREQRG